MIGASVPLPKGMGSTYLACASPACSGLIFNLQSYRMELFSPCD